MSKSPEDKQPTEASSEQPPAESSDVTEAAMAIYAREFYGDEAKTAVAYAGVETWLEGDKEKHNLWSRVLKRMSN